MSFLRVTAGSASAAGLANVDLAASRLAKLQNQLSSGNQITTPSDDPTGTVQALQLRGETQRNTQYATNSSDAIAWLSTADGAYSQVVKVLQQARTLVLQGLNTGAADSTTTQVIAAQLTDIRTSLIGLANTSYNGRRVFGGTTADGVAYKSSSAYPGDNSTVTYVGDNGAVSRSVGPNATVAVTSTGPEVFGSGSSDVFAMLQNAVTALQTNPGELSASLADLDSAISTVGSAQAGEGATYQRVQMAQTSQTVTSTALQTQLSNIQDIDIAKLAVQTTTANAAFQAALQTTANISQMSLLNFLK